MKPSENSPEPEPTPVDAELEAHRVELQEHATRVAGSIAADMDQALTMGLASRWDAGLSDDDLAFMRRRISQELRARLDAALQARGLVAARP